MDWIQEETHAVALEIAAAYEPLATLFSDQQVYRLRSAIARLDQLEAAINKEIAEAEAYAEMTNNYGEVEELRDIDKPPIQWARQAAERLVDAIHSYMQIHEAVDHSSPGRDKGLDDGEGNANAP